MSETDACIGHAALKAFAGGHYRGFRVCKEKNTGGG